MPQIPNLDCAFVEQKKILDYLLNIDHPIGKTKAKYFIGLSFSVTAWASLEQALLAHPRSNPVVEQKTDQYGTRYVVDCNFPAADGTTPCIRTVWEVQPHNPCPRLITAHPKH